MAVLDKACMGNNGTACYYLSGMYIAGVKEDSANDKTTSKAPGTLTLITNQHGIIFTNRILHSSYAEGIKITVFNRKRHVESVQVYTTGLYFGKYVQLCEFKSDVHERRWYVLKNIS